MSKQSVTYICKPCLVDSESNASHTTSLHPLHILSRDTLLHISKHRFYTLTDLGCVDFVHNGFSFKLLTQFLFLLHHSKRNFTTLTFIEGVEDLSEYIIGREEIEHRHTGADLNGIDIAKNG